MTLRLNRMGSTWNRNERININDNWDMIEQNFNGVVGETVKQAYDEIIDTVRDLTKINWLAPVPTYDDIETTYPNPTLGDITITSDDGSVYRYDGEQWVFINKIDPDVYIQLQDDVTAIQNGLEETNNNLMQLQQDFTSHLAETVTQVINIKEAYGAGSGGDDGAILQSILTSLGTNTPATIVFPKGNYTFESSVTVNGYKRIVFMDGALITVEDDIDIFIIEGNMSGVDGLRVKAPDDYTKSVITFTCSNGHRWGQYVTNFYIEGTDMNGTGIKIAPANKFGIMNTQIKNGHFRHLENAIAFDFSESDGTWCSGGTIMDIWHDFCVNGINFISGKPRLWSFQRFRGQVNSGSEFHIKDIKGYRNHFTDCYQWDGMNISIHPESVGTILDGNMISNATGVARIRDKGFRTNIKAILSSPTIQNNYFELKDNFFGADVSNHWKKNVTGTASISTVLDTGTPNTPCVKLSTGASVDSNAQLTMNSINMFPRFVECVMSFRFRLTSTDNVIVRMGMKALSNPETYSAHWSLAPGEDNFKARSGSGTLADITSIVKNTTWNVAQIIKVSDTSVVFHINDTYVGELSGVAAGMEPFFEIQNKESANKDLLITDLYARVAGY